MSYVRNKMWEDLEPSTSRIQWVARNVLNIPPALIEQHRASLPSLIYRVFYSLGPSENKYVTRWNAARADLIVDLVTPVDDDERVIRIASEPEGDLSYWLMSHVLLFADIEMSTLAGIDVDDVEDPGRNLVPIIKACYNVLRKIKLKDPQIQPWHRNRHLMIKYYLDAVYHEI